MIRRRHGAFTGMRRLLLVLGLGTFCACGGGGGDDAPGPDDPAPVANAGEDRVVLAPARVVLDGHLSSDPDGQPLTYQWRVVTSPAQSQAMLSDSTVVDPELVADRTGVFEIQLTVSDGISTSEPDVVRITATGGAPVASAGADQDVHVGATVQLDGSASVDPQGDPLGYSWTILTVPAGSGASLAGATTARPTFVADRLGRYDLQLTVGDGSAQATDVVTVNATNNAPVARAGADQMVGNGMLATLDGSASSDADGDPITYAWAVTSAPAGSTAQPATPDQAVTTFRPLRYGAYVLTLTVSDGLSTGTDTVMLTVGASGTVTVLTHDVVDAEYSNALDAIVLVSSTTSSLYIIRPETGATTTVALPLTPVAVSVSPSGTEAVVVHNAWISVVDLVNGVRTHVWSHTADPIDVVHGGNGWAYVMPRIDQWEQIRSVRLDTGVETLGWGSIYAGAVARRHPTRPSLYLADRGLSPADIEHHDLSMGNARYLRDSPYHGDYAMCGDLWFSDDGNRIFTACGNVFRATPDPATDMTYNGSLGMIGIGHVDHSDPANLVAVLPRNGWMQTDQDTTVRFFEEQFLGAAGMVTLPSVLINNVPVPTHGRFVFWNSGGDRYYVVGRATPSTGAVRDTLWASNRPS